MAATRWPGAGGRWLVWAFRAVFWAVLLIVGYRGVMAIVLNEAPPGHPVATAVVSGPKFPTTLASAFALQFGQVYLNANSATSTQRASELAQFLPSSADPQLGWNGSGSLQLQSEQVAQIHIDSAHQAVVTLLAMVNGKLMELGVPLSAGAGGLVVSGEPAWLPAPPRAVPPAAASPPASDAATQATLQDQLPAFFRAYASGDQGTLSRFAAPDATITGLAHQVTFGSLSSVFVPPGGTSRQVLATVVWRVAAEPALGIPPARLEMSYQLTVVRLHGTWFVQRIGPQGPAGGSP